MVLDSISRVDLDLRKSLFSNIVLSGGSTLCKGSFTSLPICACHLTPSRVRRPATERSKEISGEGRENKNLCPSRTKVFNVDRGFYSGWPQHFQKGWNNLHYHDHALILRSRCGCQPRNIKKTQMSFIKKWVSDVMPGSICFIHVNLRYPILIQYFGKPNVV